MSHNAAACQLERTDPPGQDIHRILAVRTPEQTALIAMRGLLEAKGLYIQKLEVWLKPGRSARSFCLQKPSYQARLLYFRLKRKEQAYVQSSRYMRSDRHVTLRYKASREPMLHTCRL